MENRLNVIAANIARDIVIACLNNKYEVNYTEIYDKVYAKLCEGEAYVSLSVEKPNLDSEKED